MTVDIDSIPATCKQLAKIIVVNNDDLEEDKVASYFQIEAEGYITSAKNIGRDPQVVARALKYLVYTHAFPRSGTTPACYAAMLEAIMGIADPKIIQTKETLFFLNDLEKGIEISGEMFLPI